MVDFPDVKKTKERSPTFPFIPLESAIERARQFYSQEKKGSAPFPVAADHWNYSPTSSGALQTVSALKNYGLMTDESSASGRKLKLSDLALRILLDTRPDDSERMHFMRMAALYPAVAAEIYQKWPDGLPSEATLNHYLVLDRGFSQSSALKTVDIIYKNEHLTKSSLREELSSNIKNYDTDRESSYSTDQELPNEAAMSAVHLNVVKTNIVRTERVIDPEGIDIILQFNGEPTIASYEFIKDYIELRIRALQRTSNASRDKEDGS